MLADLTPRQIVEELDKYIVGQNKAKRAVATALRNRYRRRLLTAELQEEIVPKNIIMIGPTGVGKTEIARRLARMVRAPFIKVEATKFTEVGYVGRDVESMVRELVETAIRMVKSERIEQVNDEAEQHTSERLVDVIFPPPGRQKQRNPFDMLFGGGNKPEVDEAVEDNSYVERRNGIREKLLAGELENMVVEIEVEERTSSIQFFGNAGVEEMGINLQDLFGNLIPTKKKKRRVTVADARKILVQEEAQKLIDMDEVISDAIDRTEQNGLIFVDEIDKIAVGANKAGGPDVSREGVQRDILPIVEGSTIVTKYGPVKTDYILFIAAGAFHVAKPSDLIPELQGRFPIRVELESLSKEDLKRILVEPKNALVKQYVALLGTERIRVEFKEDAIDEIAEIACKVNARAENIGARRLHTILETLLEELSFEAPHVEQDNVIIDREYVRKRLSGIVEDDDLSRFIL